MPKIAKSGAKHDAQNAVPVMPANNAPNAPPTVAPTP